MCDSEKIVSSELGVSVAVCTFNSARFLPMELETIAGQTVLPDEVVVCDDGSTDKTLEILESWKRSVPFEVRIVRNTENLGYTKNFERAVSMCSREVILLADHDDLWMPNRVEMVRNQFAMEPELGLISSDAELIDAEGRVQGMRLREFVERMHLHDFWRFFFPDDVKMELWTGCTMAVRRSFLPRILPIPEGIACHDVWFYLTLALISEIRFIPEPLISYRLHGQNHSTAPTVEYLRRNPSRWRYFNAFLETLDTQHPTLIDSLEEFAERELHAPAAKGAGYIGRLERFLCSLRRHKRHFEARRASVSHPGLLLRELFNGGYLRHPEPILSLLFDLRNTLR